MTPKNIGRGARKLIAIDCRNLNNENQLILFAILKNQLTATI